VDAYISGDGESDYVSSDGRTDYVSKIFNG
jgi:hypothetical protein